MNFYKEKFSITPFFISIILLLSACTKNDSTISSVTTSLKISLDKTTVLADGFDKAVLTVKNQNGEDVSDVSNILVGSANSSKNITFEYTQIGTYKVYAIKSGITSDTLTITAVSAGAAKYSSKVLLEEFTGAWAGWAPRLSYKMAGYQSNNSKVFSYAMHNKDVLTNFSDDSTLRSRLGVYNWPSAVINRSTKFDENGNIYNLNDSTNFSNFLKRRSVLGLAINSSIAGNNLTVTTKVGFDVNISDSLKLVVALVEDNLLTSQLNYYNNNTSYPGNPFINSGDTIKNYINKAVYRKSPTNILGTTINSTSQTKGGEFTLSNTIDITGYIPANLKVVAFVVFADGQTKFGVLNAQWVAAGQNKAYD
jgi:hypothetical protein